jgi:hypothetical protein
MTFKDVKQNYPVYILDKQTVKIEKGTVTAVSFPRMDMSKPTTAGQGVNMVVDVTVQVDGKQATYCIPDNLSVTYAGTLVLATEQAGLVQEVEAMREQARQVLSSVDRQKEIMKKADAILSEINPVYKEKQETETRFKSIEDSLSEIKSMFKQLAAEKKDDGR